MSALTVKGLSFSNLPPIDVTKISSGGGYGYGYYPSPSTQTFPPSNGFYENKFPVPTSHSYAPQYLGVSIPNSNLYNPSGIMSSAYRSSTLRPFSELGYNQNYVPPLPIQRYNMNGQFQTKNEVQHHQNDQLKQHVNDVGGSYSYQDPDGTKITIGYGANKNAFTPQSERMNPTKQNKNQLVNSDNSGEVYATKSDEKLPDIKNLVEEINTENVNENTLSSTPAYGVKTTRESKSSDQQVIRLPTNVPLISISVQNHSKGYQTQTSGSDAVPKYEQGQDLPNVNQHQTNFPKYQYFPPGNQIEGFGYKSYQF